MLAWFRPVIVLVDSKPLNTACIGHARAFRRTFREVAPNGGFGVWWLSPPISTLAGNPCDELIEILR
jgi:hypothetical protein